MITPFLFLLSDPCVQSRKTEPPSPPDLDARYPAGPGKLTESDRVQVEEPRGGHGIDQRLELCGDRFRERCNRKSAALIIHVSSVADWRRVPKMPSVQCTVVRQSPMPKWESHRRPQDDLVFSWTPPNSWHRAAGSRCLVLVVQKPRDGSDSRHGMQQD